MALVRTLISASSSTVAAANRTRPSVATTGAARRLPRTSCAQSTRRRPLPMMSTSDRASASRVALSTSNSFTPACSSRSAISREIFCPFSTSTSPAAISTSPLARCPREIDSASGWYRVSLAIMVSPASRLMMRRRRESFLLSL